ncbi:MAG: Holliday junction branch migration DNA helicase RuvB, partial [Candidatus Poribacteria bacterium]|nr:Holliday junction branch migration DNA helicase RuvB [Candidatus Poribacteria bacterium]
MNDERTLTPDELDEDARTDYALRPKRLDEMIGQAAVRDQLDVSIRASKERAEALDHTLFVGPQGLGKTTLAQIIANEMDVGIHQTVGTVLQRLELSSILTSLEEGDVLFIDEIHRVRSDVQEILYPALEDYSLDIVIGQGGPGAKPVRIPLPRFTLVGATTREGMLTGPLRDRFGLHLRLDYYAVSELCAIIERDARLLNIKIESAGTEEIARRARGTPRIAKRQLRRIRDYAVVRGDGVVTETIARSTLDTLGVDELGLEDMDRRIMASIAERGGYAGLTTVAAAVSEDERTIEDTYEPYLIPIGVLTK